MRFKILFPIALVIAGSELFAAPESDMRLRMSPVHVGKIELSATNVALGGSVTVSLQVRTTESVLPGMTASFYDGDPGKGGQVFAVDRVPRLEKHKTYPISATYVAKSCGTHQLFIILSQEKSAEIIRRAPPLEVSC